MRRGFAAIAHYSATLWMLSSLFARNFGSLAGTNKSTICVRITEGSMFFKIMLLNQLLGFPHGRVDKKPLSEPSCMFHFLLGSFEVHCLESVSKGRWFLKSPLYLNAHSRSNYQKTHEVKATFGPRGSRCGWRLGLVGVGEALKGSRMWEHCILYLGS